MRALIRHLPLHRLRELSTQAVVFHGPDRNHLIICHECRLILHALGKDQAIRKASAVEHIVPAKRTGMQRAA